MKKTVLLIILITFKCFAQNNEFNFDLKFGTAQRNFTINAPNNINYKIQNELYNSNDFGLNFNYKYSVLRKFNIYLGVGLDFSRLKYYYLITNNIFKVHAINISNSRFTLHLFSLHKQFVFFNSNLIIDMGVGWVHNHFLHKYKVYNVSAFQGDNSVYPYLTYKYNFEVNNTYFINKQGVSKFQFNNGLECSIESKTKISDNLFVNFGLNYTFNTIFFYNYNVAIKKGNQVIHNIGYQGVENTYRFSVKDNFLYLELGLSMKI